MRFYDDRDYPQCHKLLSTRLPAYAGRRDNKVAAAFYEVCENDELATQALTWGKDPLVLIRDLKEYKQKETQQIYGLYTGDKGGPRHELWINFKVARICEYHSIGHVQFEATVLHEMVHWARSVGYKPESYHDKERGLQEAGDAFEIKAYGMIVPRGWPGMGRHYAPSRD